MKGTWNDVSGQRVSLRSPEWPNHYGDWHDVKEGPYIVPNYTSGSDYSGSLVNVSNFDVFQREFEGTGEWWAVTHGGHGTFAIIINTFEAPTEALEFFLQLEEYPLADENDHSNLEFECQQDAWNDWVRNDFVIALRKKFDKEFENDANLSITLFEELCERTNTYWCNEEGPNMWIDLGRVLKAVTADDVSDWPEESP